jgi:hypothetical protein
MVGLIRRQNKRNRHSNFRNKEPLTTQGGHLWRLSFNDIEIELRSHRGESFLHLKFEEIGLFLNQSF